MGETQAVRPHSDLVGQTVWVLEYSHRHGLDLSVHASPEAADAAIAGIVRQWWADEMQCVDDVPETPDELADDEAVRLYFDHQDGRSEPENYAIHQLTIYG